ncbi:uncharacterized protein LOC143026346 [Oratosquilla oratoria]|uniref:uncharacterized protein LOC143026346 n=1 Tax=Oratosquilla oratoria TaxID=337810 RepID=UPI003F766ED9
MDHYKLILFYIVTGFLARGWCLSKPKVEIGNESMNFTYYYITLGELDSSEEPYSLDCIFDLDVGEELESIVWYYNKVDEVGSSIFSWKPNEEPVVSGFLDGRVNMTQNNGMIKFLERHIEYEGFYSCEVKTNAESTVSDSFQLVMADFGSRTYYSASASPDEQCVQINSMRTPALYPPPQVEYGVWNGENWIEKVQLMSINYANNSRQYTVQDHKFQVDKYPEGSSIRLTVGFVIQGKYVSVWRATSSIQPCTKKEIDNGNMDDNGNIDDNGGDSGNDNSDEDKNVATSWSVSLAASTTVVLCLLYVHY